MKRLIICIIALGLPLMSFSQEWMDITDLQYAASGEFASSTESHPTHVLQQYLLMPEDAIDEDDPLYQRLKTFAEEYGQMRLSRGLSEGSSELAKIKAEMEKMMKEYPELASELRAQLREAENQLAEYGQMGNPSVTSLSVDPAALLRDLKKLAINHKAYSQYQDIGGGLYTVTEAPVYGGLPDAHDPVVNLGEQAGYTWGAIDMEGKTVLAAKYYKIWAYYPEEDIIFLEEKGNDGAVRAGARGYDGRVRIAFIYDFYDSRGYGQPTACFSKGGKYGFVDFDGKSLSPFVYATVDNNFGFGWLVSKDGKKIGVVGEDGMEKVKPVYKELYDVWNGLFKLTREDGRVDVYDENYQFLRTENAE
ncbi:MAG: WG repeat-containing protein [Bacteroidales bacterium]|nr:WG repeat-containing protein [Bacteroidales bacterium]